MQRRDIIHFGYLVAIPGLKAIYLLTNRLPVGAVATNVLTHLDSYIPVLPIFIVPYLLFYPFVFGGLLYLFIHNRESYLQTILSYSLGLAVAYLTYVAFPTTVPRLPVNGPDVFSAMLRFIYSIDQPYNCLPSIHVLGTILVMAGIWQAERNRYWWVQLMGISIILSTMFTRQHGILDVLGGLVVGFVVFSLSGKVVATNEQQSQESVMDS